LLDSPQRASNENQENRLLRTFFNVPDEIQTLSTPFWKADICNIPELVRTTGLQQTRYTF
jgi:hypothetical protein